MKIFINLIILLFPLISFAQGHGGHESNGPQKISEGQYFGSAQFNTRSEILALQAEILQVAPHSFTDFPALQLLLKVTLGPTDSPEYMTYHFKDIRYNFETGSLYLDEEGQDLILDAKVHTKNGLTHLEGRIYSRSSNREGKFELLLKSDEPVDEDEPNIQHSREPKFTTPLEGEYQGTCDSQAAMMQIQTAKGLYSEETFGGKPLFDYGITARIGFKSPEIKNTDRPWSVYSSFAGGLYDPYNGNLVFLGPSTTSIKCNKDDDKLQCRFRIQTGQVNCNFTKQLNQTDTKNNYSRMYRLNPNHSQLLPIPQPNSTKDEDIAQLLNGNFQGFLHHENSDRYQPVSLSVSTRISTENPHNPNKVFISPTLTLQQSDFQNLATFRFESMPFYLTPGFSLSSENSDLFFIISSWTREYIFGVVYSKSYGRVGTIELLKNSKALLPPQFKTYGTISGEYLSNFPLPDQMRRWFQLLTPTHPSNRNSNSISIVGAFQHLEKLSKIEPIVRGIFDPFTQKLSWKFEHDGGEAFVTGFLTSEGTLRLYWPPLPSAFGVSMGAFTYESYLKMDTSIYNQQKEQK